MKIYDTQNGDLDFDSKDYDKLKKGIVIFPETVEDIEKIKNVKKHINNG